MRCSSKIHKYLFGSQEGARERHGGLPARDEERSRRRVGRVCHGGRHGTPHTLRPQAGGLPAAEREGRERHRVCQRLRQGQLQPRRIFLERHVGAQGGHPRRHSGGSFQCGRSIPAGEAREVDTGRRRRVRISFFIYSVLEPTSFNAAAAETNGGGRPYNYFPRRPDCSKRNATVRPPPLSSELVCVFKDYCVDQCISFHYIGEPRRLFLCGSTRLPPWSRWRSP